MMGKNNYQDCTKEDLIQEIKRLKKRRKCGLVWLTITKYLCLESVSDTDLKVVERLKRNRGNRLLGLTMDTIL
jgi:hypothetical protein